MYSKDVLEGATAKAVSAKTCAVVDHDVKEKVQALVKHCAQYQKPDNAKAITQLANTLIPFFIICALMIYSFSHAYWITALLTVPASFLLVRIFIIQHDCGHGSFFASRVWNNRVGRLMSLLTWTPYDFWRKTHNMHHSSSGNLDNRGFGAIETITVREYEELSDNLKFWYRMYRNPYLMLLFGTPFFIIIGQRIPNAEPFPFYKSKKTVTCDQIWRSVFGLNAALLAFYGTLTYIFGWKILLAYLPVVVVTAIIGGWLFFIQHQFEEAYWANHEDWDYHEAAVLGSSYYDLHPILQWFTGNIGLHHIHHLNAKIPNYRLQECMDDNEDLKTLNRITLWESFKYAHLALWDEGQQKMIRFT
ncbi:MAG: fatty acid desaturase [Alphaproteobacteria bacterium]|nr:fatty acid desaturase [Alphaproteobacteria bacterium]